MVWVEELVVISGGDPEVTVLSVLGPGWSFRVVS